MDRDEIESFIEETVTEEVKLPDDLDDGFIGIAADMEPPCAVYSIPRSIDSLIKGGMSRDDATEWFHYNILGSMQEGHPIYIETPE
tara:strand:+ start:973 stop:1230 length:258 start_codon:yes stop_codon:yes gene_type:complete